MKMTPFPPFRAFLAKQISKMHKVTSFQDGVRKFLAQKFWSLGTHLGSLGPGSKADVGLGSCRLQFLVIWGPYECPALMACQGTAENPNLIGARCDTDGNIGTISKASIPRTVIAVSVSI